MCKRRKPQAINILSFNVEGLKPKLGDPNFKDFIQKYDVVIFTETWKANTSKINIEGYCNYSQIRPKYKNAIRHSGGITVLTKDIIRPGIKLVENTKGFLWFKLDKNFFQTENDIFLCGAYIPPKNTTKNILAKTDYFGNFEKAILKYKEKGNILVLGDLNTRTGSQGQSQHNIDNHLQHLLPEADKLPSDLDRCSYDGKINASGRTLLKICNKHNLRIYNGQTSGDRLGNYTCFNYEGASAVDYLIVEETIYEKILNFRVLPPTFDSKHSPIVATLKCHTKLQTEKGKLLNPRKTYHWDSLNSPLFKMLINSQES